VVQPGSGAGSSQVGVGSGSRILLAKRYSSSLVSFSASSISMGKWYWISSNVSDSESELTGELGGKK
jgi:hypothetical protein